MFAEWIVGLFAAFVATPVAVASYLSAYHAAHDEHHASESVRVLRHVATRGQVQVGHHRHYHRHIAA
jgi:hypothetical protein